jgi:serine/threonine protein kinase/WD40 repeat protein
MATIDLEPADRDERLGEAIEEFLELIESGSNPDPDQFASRYPDLSADLREALEGLSLVRGLVGAPAAAGRRLENGCRLAGYRIVGELGAGGMGVVYEAVHVDLDRPVALKVLDSRATRDGNGLRRFLNEARTAAGLHHTHIVPVFDVGHVGGLCYYAMQRIEGSGLDRVVKALRRDRSTGAGSGSGRRSALVKPEPLYDISGLSAGDLTGSRVADSPGLKRSRRDDPPPPFEPPRGSGYYRWVAEVGRQAAQALAYAHRRGVIHRDIKPSNLLIDARGGIWVADFGLARRLADPNVTHSDSLIGTPRYMSPEQSRSSPTDSRTDVYSLGATLYELLTLRPPFEGKTTAELIEQIGGQEPISPRRHDPRIPRDLETIVLKCLAKRPSDRYEGAAELADDLQRFLSLEPVKARRIGPIGRLWRLARRHPAITMVSTTAAAAILAVATVAYIRVVQERDRAVNAEQLSLKALREGKLSQAILMRSSTVPDRRERGLALIREAAGMKPDFDLRARLRDEAIEFLALRDVEKRPELPTGRTLGMAFGPEERDSPRMATVSDDGQTFTLWSTADGKPLGEAIPAGPPRPERRERDMERGGGPARFGQRIAIAGPQGAVIWPTNRGVRLFDAFNGALMKDIPTPGRELIALFALNSPDGPRLVLVEQSALPDGEAGPPGRGERRAGPGPRFGPPKIAVTLWDPDRPDGPIATLDPKPGDGLPTFPLLAIAPDGETIATAWWQGTTVSLWAGSDGHSLDEIDAGAIRTLALGPYGQLAVAGVGAVRLWDITTRESLTTVTPHQNNVAFLRFSSDGTMLAVAGFGSDVEIWDPASNTLIAALPTAGRVHDLAFGPGGRLLAAALSAAQSSSVALWAIVDSTVRNRSSGFEAAPTSLAFAPDGCLALAMRGMAPAKLWQPVRCPTTAQPLDAPTPSAVAFDTQGRLVALAGNDLVVFEDHEQRGTPRTIALDEPHLPDPLWRGRPVPADFLRQAQSLGRSPDGRRLAVVRLNQILLWESEAPERVRPIDLPRLSPPADAPGNRSRGGRNPGPGGGGGAGRSLWKQAVVSSTGARLYAFSWTEELHAWQLVGNRAQPLGWKLPPLDPTVLALSPDGATLAVGQREGGLVLIDTRSGQIRDRYTTLGGVDEPITALAFAPQQPVLAVGTKSGAVWLAHLPNEAGTTKSAAAAEPPLRLPGRHGDVLALAFDNTGRHLATASEDKSVEVWDLQRLARELERLGMKW